jgi:glucose/arabinose dehydrogenase
MKNLCEIRALFLLAFVSLSVPAAAAMQLVSVVTTGLSSPLYLTHAGDGSNRLFIVERSGLVRVVQPGTSTASVFLDVRRRIVSGSEQGLLGLAFHPAYASNGRLFAYYTRAGDGALVIAEYRRSPDPSLADPAENIVLVIAHPRESNHNGGMLAFGPDGYLYLGVGDGGSGNDPLNNAQNVDVLLGKILRIDVDRQDPLFGNRYASPSDNPFVNAPGRDEIYATGLRNPWRFSFDRATGALWVGDVGQDAREEVHAPVIKGGNYGWRVYEGTSCTNNDPMLCNPASFIAPLFEYGHSGGRCSITGGYVYRGSRGALPAGTYVYGDFCTGEIFGWNGTEQTLLLDTSMGIASFGEDEQGELYVVDLGGTVSRIAERSLATAIEYFHAGFGHYFTTSLATEIATLDAGVFSGWARTGQSFLVDPAGGTGNATANVDVCRFFSAGFAPKSSHFYTPLAGECEIVKGNARWQFEGEVFSVTIPDLHGACPVATIPLYRLYNDGQGGAPNHRYTTSFDTRATMLAQGWVPEGFGVTGVIACVPG